MPMFAVRLSNDLFSSIKALIDAGHYPSVERFIEVAAINQLALERGTSPDELELSQHAGQAANAAYKPVRSVSSPKDTNIESGRAEETRSRKPRNSRITRTAFVLQKTQSKDNSSDEIPLAIFEPFARRTEISTLMPAAISPSEDVDRIFGQVNRLFPIKVACRAIANTALTNGSWPEYSLVHDLVGEHSAKLGSLLEKWDRELDRKREDQLATGLPKRGNSASRDRFLSQLVARVTRAGDVYPGAACHYQLAVFEGGRVALTAQGLEFASLENPILDSPGPQTTVSLSDEEVAFLINQITARVPLELADMRAVLQHIVDGKTTPGALNQSVRANLPSEWTEGMMLTHISGLVARLADLSIIRRQWDGRFVKYQLGHRQRVDALLGN